MAAFEVITEGKFAERREEVDDAICRLHGDSLNLHKLAGADSARQTPVRSRIGKAGGG